MPLEVTARLTLCLLSRRLEEVPRVLKVLQSDEAGMTVAPPFLSAGYVQGYPS